MAMRETAKSLRAYFIIAGILSLGSGNSALGAKEAAPFAAVTGLFAVVFGLGFLVAGIRLPRILAGSTRFVRVLLFANVGYQLLLCALFLAAGAGAVALAFPALYVAICWYLLANVKRLAGEQQSPNPPKAAAAARP
jgi:hypothetical protein